MIFVISDVMANDDVSCYAAFTAAKHDWNWFQTSGTVNSISAAKLIGLFEGNSRQQI